MAYTPTEWETGDVITAEKLNKAEQGIAAASDVIYVNFTLDNGTASCDASFADIFTAINTNKKAVFADLSVVGETRLIFPLSLSDSDPEYCYVYGIGFKVPSITAGYPMDYVQGYGLKMYNSGDADVVNIAEFEILCNTN